jgi:hypothetical protein
MIEIQPQIRIAGKFLAHARRTARRPADASSEDERICTTRRGVDVIGDRTTNRSYDKSVVWDARGSARLQRCK